MNRINFNIKDRKLLYGVLSIVLICVFTLSIAYAALSVTLNIVGSASVVGSDWDIHFENVIIKNGSVTNNMPNINGNTLSFSTTLNMPGDYYAFTVDVVNSGSIDAMIDSISKSSTLTSEQERFINYVVEYENGEKVYNRQLISAGDFVRLEVKVEYLRDINASDLPSSSLTLDFDFVVNYTQFDKLDSSEIINNGVSAVNVVSGDYDTMGSEVCIGNECFYVIDSNHDSVTLFAKHNLYVGYHCVDIGDCTLYESPTGKQDETMRGFVGANIYPIDGVVQFSESKYWSSSSYPAYVYDENSLLYDDLENYKLILINEGVRNISVRMVSADDLLKLGCNSNLRSCSSAPAFVYNGSYLTGVAYSSSNLHAVTYNSGMTIANPTKLTTGMGLRVVVEISKSEF